MQPKKTFVKTVFLFFLLALFPDLSAQSLPLSSQYWKIINNDNNEEIDFQTVQFKGKEAIHLKRHQISLLKKGDYDNFVIEMDIAGASMPGIGFRAKDLWNYEYVYCRIFSSNKQDALQYIPIYNGAQSWQLYNYPTYESSAEFSNLEWFHLKMEVYGNYMRVYVGDSEQANLEVELLHDQLESGDIFLKTTFNEAYYTNIEIRPLEKPFSVEDTEQAAGFLNDWEVSEQLEGNFYSQRLFFQKLNHAEEKGKWKSVQADKNGIVNLSKYFEYPQQSAFAKTTIQSDQAKEIWLEYDYTQVLMIVLNGQILFHGRELDTGNFMRMMAGEESITLPLQAGDNQLVFWIRSDDEWQKEVGNPPYLGRDQAMNWGFLARMANERK